jgi:hypothetical protein
MNNLETVLQVRRRKKHRLSNGLRLRALSGVAGYAGTIWAISWSNFSKKQL